MAQSTPKVVVFTHPLLGKLGLGLFVQCGDYHFIYPEYKLNTHCIALDRLTKKTKNIMDSSVNILNWFEVSVSDIKRAKKFYETIFSITMEEQEMMGMKMVGFPSEMGNGKASGALVQSEMHKPSTDGAVIYLNANPSIQSVIDRIETSGGKVVMPKTQISPEIGNMAFFIDSEGNKVGLHAQN